MSASNIDALKDDTQCQKMTKIADLKMKTWLHIVARTKTIPKDFVCGEDCEQHSIYGRLFDGHPLNHVKSESEKAESEKSESEKSESEKAESEDETLNENNNENICFNEE